MEEATKHLVTVLHCAQLLYYYHLRVKLSHLPACSGAHPSLTTAWPWVETGASRPGSVTNTLGDLTLG